MKSRDPKTCLLDHSAAKLRLLTEYLRRYLNIVTNDKYTDGIRIYDLFCGEGLYENGGEGSPLAIMRCIKDVHFTNVAKSSRIIPIDCHFNDIEQWKVEKVERLFREKSLHYPEFGKVSFSAEDYRSFIPKLTEEISVLQAQRQKIFVFIDPYEYKHIAADQIRSLLARKNAEVLLFLPTQFMYRFDGKGTPNALKDFIEELVDYQRWTLNSASVWDYIDQLKVAFRDYLGKQHFVDTFTIEKDPSTVFCLFFFTSHIKGFEKMLEAKWEIDTEQGKGWDYTHNAPTLFGELRANPLERKMEAFLKEGGRTNGEVYEFTVRLGFLPKHANEILYNWQQAEMLEVVLRNGERARKRSFYIDYRHFRDEGNRVHFQLGNKNG